MSGIKLMNSDEIIYFICEDPYQNMVKIGKTNNIEKRLYGIQTGNPRLLKVAINRIRPKKYDYEKIFHKLFFKNFVRGEWYKIDTQELVRIEIIMKNKDPIEEIKILCEEFLKYETNVVVNEEKCAIGNPPENTNRCGSKLHVDESINKEKNTYICVDKDKKEKKIREKIHNNARKQYLAEYYEAVLIDHPNLMDKYSKYEIKECHKEMIYRDLTNEQIEQMDTKIEGAKFADKTHIKYLFGRHVTINKIKDLFKSGECDSKTLINYIAEIHKMKNPLLKGVKEIKSANVLNSTNKLLSAYGYKITTKQVRDGTGKKRVYNWKDYSTELFIVKTLPFNSDEFTISAIRQSGNSKIPSTVVCER